MSIPAQTFRRSAFESYSYLLGEYQTCVGNAANAVVAYDEVMVIRLIGNYSNGVLEEVQDGIKSYMKIESSKGNCLGLLNACRAD